MARFKTEGLEEIISDMDKMGLTTGDLADEMLLAGAEEVKKAWKIAIKKHKHVDTSDMLEKVNYSRKVKQVKDVKSVDIYPQGKDKKGVRNAEKAFVLHYGRSTTSGTFFIDDADDISGPLVEQKYKELFTNWLKVHGWRE